MFIKRKGQSCWSTCRCASPPILSLPLSHSHTHTCVVACKGGCTVRNCQWAMGMRGCVPDCKTGSRTREWCVAAQQSVRLHPCMPTLSHTGLRLQPGHVGPGLHDINTRRTHTNEHRAGLPPRKPQPQWESYSHCERRTTTIAWACGAWGTSVYDTRTYMIYGIYVYDIWYIPARI